MNDYTVAAYAINLSYLLITLGVIRVILYYLDKSMGISFKTMVWGKINEDSLATAVYFGFRFIGVCLLASAFLR